MGDLALKRLWDVLERLRLIPARIVKRDADDLVVLALLVPHLEQRDRLHPDHASGEGRLGDADHRVEWVTVAATVPDQVAVVRRVHGGRGEKPVEDELVELLVVLVLVAAPLRDLAVGEEVIVVAGHLAEGYPAPADEEGRCAAGDRPRGHHAGGLWRR